MSLVAPWDVYDLDDEELQGQLQLVLAAIKQQPSEAHNPTQVEELKQLIERELLERKISVSILEQIDGKNDAPVQSEVLTLSPQKAQGNTDTLDSSFEKPEATDSTPVPLQPVKRKGLWDSSGESSSSDAEILRRRRIPMAKLSTHGYVSLGCAKRPNKKRRLRQKVSPPPEAAPVTKQKPPVPSFNSFRKKASTPSPIQQASTEETSSTRPVVKRSTTPLQRECLSSKIRHRSVQNSKDLPMKLLPKNVGIREAFVSEVHVEDVKETQDDKDVAQRPLTNAAPESQSEAMNPIVNAKEEENDVGHSVEKINTDDGKIPVVENQSSSSQAQSLAGNSLAPQEETDAATHTNSDRLPSAEVFKEGRKEKREGIVCTEVVSVKEPELPSLATDDSDASPVEADHTTPRETVPCEVPKQERPVQEENKKFAEAETEEEQREERSESPPTGNSKIENIESKGKPVVQAACDAESNQNAIQVQQEKMDQHLVVPQPNALAIVVEKAKNNSKCEGASGENERNRSPLVPAALPAKISSPSIDYSPFFSCLEEFMVDSSHLRPVYQMQWSVAQLHEAYLQFIGRLQVWKKEEESLVENGVIGAAEQNSVMCYRIQQSREEVYDLITSVLDERNSPPWVETESACWNVWWTWRKPKPKEPVWLSVQFVNHIPKTSFLTRKDLLKNAIQRYRRGRSSTAQQFHVLPISFNLPSEYVQFSSYFGEHRGIWIMKTVGMSRGRGIKLVSSIEDVTYKDPTVIQQYVDRPFMIDGYKFDLRLYLVVTQFSPLECFLSRRGFARFCSVKYTTEDLTNKYIHLTNTAVSNVAKSSTVPSGNVRYDTKWDLEKLASKLQSQGIVWSTLWDSICQCMLRTVCCAEDNIGPCPCCFELFGFDVLLDADLKPWILEVNASPALDVDNPIDESVKPALIDDIFNLLDPLPYDKEALLDALSSATTLTAEKDKAARKKAFNMHVTRILRGRVPRRYGEPPKDIGKFDQLAPSANYSKITKQKKCAV